MQETVLFVIAIIVGLGVLAWSADRFVTGASGLARRFGVSPLIIGLTIVAFGTSAPEMLISAMAAAQGNSGIAIGNAVGSNIANMALVLGVTALLVPLTVQSQTLNREFPLMLLVMLAALALLWNGILSRLDGLALLAGMVALVLWTIHLARSAPPDDPLEAEFAAEMPAAMPAGQYGWLVDLWPDTAADQFTPVGLGRGGDSPVLWRQRSGDRSQHRRRRDRVYRSWLLR